MLFQSTDAILTTVLCENNLTESSWSSFFLKHLSGTHYEQSNLLLGKLAPSKQTKYCTCSV